MKITKQQLRKIIKEEVDKELKQETVIEENFIEKVKDFFRGGKKVNKAHVNKVMSRMEKSMLDEYNAIREAILENPNIDEEGKRELLDALGPPPVIRGR